MKVESRREDFMRKRKKWSVAPKYLLLIGTIFCFLLIVLSFKYKEQFTSVRTFVGSVFMPMQKGINSVGGYFSEKLDLLTSKQELIDENKMLKAKLDSVSYDNRVLQQEKYELESLRKLYDLDQKYPSYPKVAARVVSRESNNWYNIFTIDKGTEDGLAVDMNVIAGNGLVGIITEVGKHYSRVRSIIDDKSNVSGMFLKTSDTCIVKGNLKLINEGTIEVEMISKDANISDGYEIVTSHVSDKYLQGVLIGYVTDITLDANGLTKRAKLTPVVNFDKLDTVLVITQVKDSSELKDMVEYENNKASD